MTALRLLSRYSPAWPPASRVLLVVLAFGVSACGSDTSGPKKNDNTVASVAVTPASATLNSLGATTQLTASAKNASGTTVSGVTFDWTSSDASVATVSASGVVTAVANGSATITATASGTSISGTAQITVQQTAAAVTVTPQDGSVVIGQTLQLSATATDAGGSAIQGATFTWSSSNDAVATVSNTGLVTGVSDGTVTITAASGSANGTAPVTVTRPDLEFTQDTNISGRVVANNLTIPAGVTVTATDSVEISASGMIEIAGTLTGDCVGIAVFGDTAVTVTGTVRNGCAPGQSVRPLTIAASGELTLEDALVVSSGDIELTNDTTLVDSDFPASVPGVALVGGPLGGGAVARADGLERAGSGVPFTRVNRSTIRFEGGETGPNPADDGTDGTDGTDGKDGRRVRLRLRGNAEFAGNTLLWGQDGGRGGHGTEAKDSNVDVEGGDGGDGGDIRIHVTGTLTYSGAANVVRTGSGGDGGNATATGLPNASGSKAPSATATAGNGGDPGLMEIRAGGGIVINGISALKIEVGRTGDGGNATATGADGADATATDAAQEGGDAEATGGDGGQTPDRQLAKRGNVTGNDPTLSGVDGESPDGGKGGDATATAGNGGNGMKPNKDGAAGGAIQAKGGKGGDALIKDLDGNRIGNGGDGGKATFKGGNGGDGWDDCQDPQNPEAGGAGGAGGSASGGDGAGGQGAANGAPGDTHFENVGNGGDGKREDGAAGAAGTNGANTLGNATTVDPVFQPGQPGGKCAPPPPPQETYVDQGSIPNNFGLVDFGSYILNLLDALSQVVGSMQVSTYGTSGNHFVGLSPARFGYFGNNGWDLALNSAQVEGDPFDVHAVEVCYYNSSVDSENPAVIQQLDAEGGVLAQELVTSLAAPSQPGPQRIGEGGSNCRVIERVIGAVILRFFGPPTQFIDIGGLSFRPGFTIYGQRMPSG